MKIWILSTLVILVIAGWMGWRQQRTHGEVERVHRELVARAAELGVSTVVDADPAEAEAKAARRETDRRDEEAREFARQLIAFALEMKAMEEDGATPDEELQQRSLEVIDRLLDLDARQMKVLIAELRDTRELDEEARQQILGFSLIMLAQEHPETALALSVESSDLLDDERFGTMIISQSLGRLAAEDPMAAIEWIRANAESHPGLVDDAVKRAVVSGAARQDPVLALGLVDELGLETHEVATSAASAAVTGEQRTQLLAAVRKEGDDELLRQTLTALSNSLAEEGFEAATDWVEGAELSAQEFDSLLLGLGHHATGQDTGRWIEWIEAERGEAGKGPVESMMRQWTDEDYRAAGEWLSGMEAGTTRDAAVRGYVLAVAPYDPQAAAQWVDTLPQGKPRRSLAEQVVEHWKGKDEAAAAAFAESEGLE